MQHYNKQKVSQEVSVDKKKKWLFFVASDLQTSVPLSSIWMDRKEQGAVKESKEIF